MARTRIERDGFDVTCVIGRVTFDPDAIGDPYTAAFVLIGEHNAPGTFTFPNADGGTVVVSVAHEPNDL